MSLNNLLDTNQDSDDDNEDEDFRPENEVLSDNSDSGSEPEVEEEVSDRNINKTNGKQRIEENKEINEEVSKEVSKQQTQLFQQKSDSLWEEFQKDLTKSDSNNTNISDDISGNSGSHKTTVTKTYDFAGEEVKVTEEVTEEAANTSDSKSNTKSDTKESPPKSVKRLGGLSNVLSQLKKPKISVLQKSAIDWKTFKQNKGIEEEMNLHNRSKDTFVERQAFLQRTDVRQFEIEKQIREKNRSQRQLSKD